MNNKLNNIFSETDCLSPEILSDYAQNRLSRDDMYLVEKHLAECELCSDALEGLSLVGKRRQKKIIASIHHLIDKRVMAAGGKLIRFDFRTRLAVAAVVICIVGITILFRFILKDSKHGIMALRTAKESEQAPDEAKFKAKMADSLSSQEQKPGAAKAKKNEQQKVISDEEYTIKEESQNDVPLVTLKSEQTSGGKAAAEQNVTAGYFWFPQKDENKEDNANGALEEKIVANDLNEVADAKKEPDREVMADSISVTQEVAEYKSLNLSRKNAKEKKLTESQATSKATKKAEVNDKTVVTATGSTVAVSANTSLTTDSRYATGMQKYDSLDYSGSKVQFESYLAIYPDDYNAQYYCGASNYFLKNYDQAIVYFEKVLKKKSGAFYQTAQWYTALCYVAKKDDASAEKILNAIVTAGGSFKTQAEAKLLEIKK